jgi:hypothetical protein
MATKKKSPARTTSDVGAIKALIADARKATDILIANIPSLTTDDIRAQQLVNELSECVHMVSGLGGLDDRLRTADQTARRKARAGSAVA